MCQEAVDKVAEVFRANSRPDPRHDLSRNIDDNLLLQYHGYANTDPPTKQQKAITLSFYRHNYNRSTTQTQKALNTLSIAAFLSGPADPANTLKQHPTEKLNSAASATSVSSRETVNYTSTIPTSQTPSESPGHLRTINMTKRTSRSPKTTTTTPS